MKTSFGGGLPTSILNQLFSMLGNTTGKTVLSMLSLHLEAFNWPPPLCKCSQEGHTDAHQNAEVSAAESISFFKHLMPYFIQSNI